MALEFKVMARARIPVTCCVFSKKLHHCGQNGSGVQVMACTRIPVTCCIQTFSLAVYSVWNAYSQERFFLRKFVLWSVQGMSEFRRFHANLWMHLLTKT